MNVLNVYISGKKEFEIWVDLVPTDRSVLENGAHKYKVTSCVATPGGKENEYDVDVEYA